MFADSWQNDSGLDQSCLKRQAAKGESLRVTLVGDAEELHRPIYRIWDRFFTR